MSGLNRTITDKKFNLAAVECLAQIGLSEPVQSQIDRVEKFLQRVGQTGKGRSKFTRAFMLEMVTDSNGKY